MAKKIGLKKRANKNLTGKTGPGEQKLGKKVFCDRGSKNQHEKKNRIMKKATYHAIPG